MNEDLSKLKKTPLVIEKSIPIPPKAESTEKLMDIVMKMSVGDSVLVPLKTTGRFRSLIYGTGFKPVMRREGSFFRVWKTDKSPSA